MKIAIVDDLAADRALIRHQLEQELARRRLESLIEEYDSGEAFAENFHPGEFAIVFLDIYMKGMDGIQIARLLYQNDFHCKIIFLTVSEEYLKESYSVHAAYYLVKPYTPRQLTQALDFCFPRPALWDILPVRTRQGILLVPRQDILYIEAKGRHPHIYTEKEAIESMDNFSQITYPLEKDSRFFCCCRGIIVHLGKISTLKENTFILSNGSPIPISRRIRPEAIRAFHSFVFQDIRKENPR